ncbi:MAG: hypothetical protein AVDCRST_MAG93-9200, partial [uncultured Chloroflexia bacterium]
WWESGEGCGASTTGIPCAIPVMPEPGCRSFSTGWTVRFVRCLSCI